MTDDYGPLAIEALTAKIERLQESVDAYALRCAEAERVVAALLTQAERMRAAFAAVMDDGHDCRRMGNGVPDNCPVCRTARAALEQP